MELAIIILVLLVAISLAAVFLLYKSLLRAKSQTGNLTTENALLTERLNVANQRLDDAEKAQKQHQEDIERERQHREELAARQEQRDAEREKISELRFKNLANEILDVNSRQFNARSEEQLVRILNPLKTDIEQFKKAVTDSYSTEARERFSLQEKIKELVELNKNIGREARELTEALKGNSKVQGDWGEMILETILEKSGLKKGLHFNVQQTTDMDGKTLRDENGRSLRPDVVINYPDGRCLVIDSKVSLTAYVGLVNADNTEEAESYGRQHLLSIKQHIKELADKKYQEYVGDKKTDFVMMFIPNEAAYLTAMNLEPNLWQDAYDRRVLIISPTHLISALRLVEQLWRQDDIKKNVLAIAEESGKMYDKFVGFVDDLQKVSKNIELTRTSMDSAMKKLNNGTGNLVRRAENIRKMGAKTSKSLPQSLLDDEESNDLKQPD